MNHPFECLLQLIKIALEDCCWLIAIASVFILLLISFLCRFLWNTRFDLKKIFHSSHLFWILSNFVWLDKLGGFFNTAWKMRKRWRNFAKAKENMKIIRENKRWKHFYIEMTSKRKIAYYLLTFQSLSLTLCNCTISKKLLFLSLYSNRLIFQFTVKFFLLFFSKLWNSVKTLSRMFLRNLLCAV